MIIKEVEPGGIADDLGLNPGDEIVRLNGEKLRDMIDYQFKIVDEEILLAVKQNNELFEIEIEKDYGDDLGVIFEDIKYRHCGSDCVFCFVDQNPEGMRPALNFRDEDFRLSFLHGSYFTLNNVSKADMDRMIEQRLSPLYISVHALDREVRNYLFGVNRDDKLLEKIEKLTSNGIELHTQVVLCPGINDSDVLQRTIEGLEKYFPGIRSIAIVPLGLTKHREGIEKLEPVTAEYALETVKSIHKIQREFLKKHGERFVFLSDEWYLISGKKLPSLQHYGELYQLENGVGMTRQFIKSIKSQSRLCDITLPQSRKLHLMTGALAHPLVSEHLLPILDKINGLTVSAKTVVNEFYGSSVHVSGLLTGSDFMRELKKYEADLFLLPPNCLNPDNLMLDNYTIEQIERESGKNIMVYTGQIADTIEKLLSI